MNSPFPGMDPYLEAHWGDVHNSLVTYARAALNELLPHDLRARAEERILVELPSHDQAHIPDVRVVEPPLAPDDEAWADALLRSAGRRGVAS